MPKYYVQSGNMRLVISRENIDNACAAMVSEWLTCDTYKLGEIILISEQGFDVHSEDIIIGTRDLLNGLGIEFTDLNEHNHDTFPFTQENEDEPSGSC